MVPGSVSGIKHKTKNTKQPQENMNILVCIKAVPDDEQHGPDSGWPLELPEIPLRMNSFDTYAMETAIRIKEAVPGTSVDALTMGPPEAAAVIKRAAGMGANNGIHILTQTRTVTDPFSIASAIAAVAGSRGYDLIIAGAMSEDLMQMAVGPMIAGRLDLPCATAVIHQQIDFENGKIYVEREIEGGNREMFNLRLPALITVQSGICTPRYPSLSNMLRANRMSIEIIDADTVLPDAAAQTIVSLEEPEKMRAGRVLEGSATEKADQLIAILREQSLLR